MFLILLVALLVAASLHAAVSGRRSRQSVAELFLLYILVGYCGVAMLAVSSYSLLAGDRVATWLGWSSGSPFQQFLGWALLGMAAATVLSLRYRQTYLIAPVVAWSVFFLGATFVHLAHLGGHGASHGTVLHVFATHTSIPVLLVGLLAFSGATPLRRSRDQTEADP